MENRKILLWGTLPETPVELIRRRILPLIGSQKVIKLRGTGSSRAFRHELFFASERERIRALSLLCRKRICRRKWGWNPVPGRTYEQRCQQRTRGGKLARRGNASRERIHTSLPEEAIRCGFLNVNSLRPREVEVRQVMNDLDIQVLECRLERFET